jgi:transcriptional regulator with PAS, ATPase and Fis domain
MPKTNERNTLDDIDVIRQENNLLKRILDTLDAGICFVDAGMKIVYNNKMQHKVHQYLNTDADGKDISIGKDVRKVYPGTGHVQAQELQMRSTKEELKFHTSGITVRSRYIPIFDDDEHLIGSLGVTKRLDDYRDISLEVKNSKSIFNSFSIIFDNLQEAIVAVNTSGKIVYANNAYAQIVGEKTEDLIGHKIKIDELGIIAHDALSNAKSVHESIVNLQEGECDVISFPIISENVLLGCFCILNSAKTFNLLSEQIERKTQVAEYYRHMVNSQMELPSAFDTLIGEHPRLVEQLSTAVKAAVTDCSVMILGSNGVGKELVAKAIHNASARSTGPFIAINCAALPDNLLESELFGYEPGAFTGAKKEGKPGKFELAHGGTLFLDEIGNMSYYMQAKLLRILQTRENERIGGTKVTKVDVRILSATNKNLNKMIMQNEFREDLYYRLNVVIINLPDLKDRKSDIPLLVEHFLNEFSKHGEKAIKISEEAMDLLMRYDWPGNIREMRNVIERSVVIAEDGVIQPYHLPSNLWLHDKDDESNVIIIGKTIPLEELVNACEKQAFIRALNENNGNKTAAMKALNLSRRAFYYKMDKHGLH